MRSQLLLRALLLALPLLPVAAVSLRAQVAGPRIHLRTRTFDPLASPQLAAQAASNSMYLLQFDGPVRDEWKAAVTRAGAKLYGYLPEHSFVARMDAATAVAVRELPHVRWVGPYRPEDRVEPQLAEELDAGVPVTVTVQTLPDADLDALAARLRGWGGEVQGRARNAGAGYVQTVLPSTRLPDLAASDGVLWVEPFVAPELLNNTGGSGILRVDSVRQQLGLYGAGQIVGVADSGLDTGNAATLHPDVRGRVLQAACLGRPSPCDWSDADGHGTHVVGSVLGNGAASGSNPGAHQYTTGYAGTAPEAQLVFQGVGDAQGGLGGIPTDRGDLMRQAYAQGARIHTNSWGGPTGGSGNVPAFGGYTQSSQQVDQVAWERKDMLILFAAGNSGADGDGNGVIDGDAIGQPGTAKNSLTIGASENNRPSIAETWGTRFGPAPIRDDKRADQPNGMAAFSSRGPTDDGRIKPELAAPGTFVASMRTGGVFSDNMESGTERYSRANLGGGTAAWTLVGDAHSPSRAWNQTLNGSFGAGAMTAVLTPPMNVLAIGGPFGISWWHKWSLGGDDKLVLLIVAPTIDDPSVLDFGSLTLDNSGSNAGYAPQTESLSPDELIQAGLDPRAVQLGFAVRSGDSVYNSWWTIDDLRVGGEGTMAELGLAQPGDAIDQAYTAISGTSMATPLTAGAAALVREWLTRIKGVAQPSAALIKALLMNGAADMGAGQYGTGAAREIPATRPNNVSGWGRVDVLESLAPAAPGRLWFTDDNSGLATGASREYVLQVGSATGAVTPAATTQLLQNGGFESGSLAPWQAIGDDFYSHPRVDTSTAHGGTYSALMTATTNDIGDTIVQRISVPANATAATFDFWHRISSTETNGDAWCYGFLDDGGVLVAGTCAPIRGDVPWTRKTWTLTEPELALLRGKSLRATFYTINTNNQRTSRLWVDDTSFTVNTPDAPPAPPAPSPAPGGSPLRVTLNWTDFPGQPGAARALVNNLDLEVVAPDGTRYAGNAGVYPAGHPCAPGGADGCNPSEGVFVPTAAPGQYTVVVRAREVPQGGAQPFALAASGALLSQIGGPPPGSSGGKIMLPMAMR